MDVGLHGCPPPVQPVIVPKVHSNERALYFNSTLHYKSTFSRWLSIENRGVGWSYLICPSFFLLFSTYLPPCICPVHNVRVGRDSDIYTCFRTYAHAGHQVVYYSVQRQKPIPSFPSGTLAGDLRSYVLLSGNYSESAGHIHIKMGPDIYTGEGR